MGQPVESGVHELHDKGLFGELGWFTQLLRIDDNLYLVPGTRERSAGEITMLTEVIGVTLGRSMAIYLSHASDRIRFTSCSSISVDRYCEKVLNPPPHNAPQKKIFGGGTSGSFVATYRLVLTL